MKGFKKEKPISFLVFFVETVSNWKQYGSMVSMLDLHADVPGSNDHCLDLSWVIPESYPPRSVNSQLVCLLSVGDFNCVFQTRRNKLHSYSKIRV